MSIPSIGFFALLPLPMMIPFMGIQSAVMAEQFGTMFQYGKRRISAMSNEEFNALTPEILQKRMTEQITAMIPEMQKQIQAMTPLVKIILETFGSYITEAGDVLAHTIAGPSAHVIPHDNLLSPEEWEKQQLENLASAPTPLEPINVGDTVPIIDYPTPEVTDGWTQWKAGNIGGDIPAAWYPVIATDSATIYTERQDLMLKIDQATDRLRRFWMEGSDSFYAINNYYNNYLIVWSRWFPNQQLYYGKYIDAYHSAVAKYQFGGNLR